MTRVSQPLSVQPGTQYMLTLCELSAPTRIRTPDSETMRQFRFFMSRSRAANGAEPLRLHMGYFESLGQAQHWAQTMRARFPAAKVEPVPLKILQQRSPDTATIAPAVDVPVLSDTQVLRVLDARRFTPVDATEENDVRDISLVGPEDTQVRRQLKEAVIQGAPVLFAVQLLESPARIELKSVPALSIFRAYTLYGATTTREHRTAHSLRLGFFKDAISAKQVAYFVRSHFESVAVVPVTEAEQEHANTNPVDSSQLCDPFQQTQNEVRQSAPTPSRSSATTARAEPAKRPGDNLERTLELLAETEMWNDPDSHAETGVRHLKLEVQRRKSRG